MEPICQTQSNCVSWSVKIKHLRRFGRFYLLRVSTSKRSPKRMQLSLIVGIAVGFWLISDLPISGWSGFPHFRLSLFPVYVTTCVWPCRAGWVEGLSEIVALKFPFSDPKWDLPSWFSDSRVNFHLWTVVLHSYLARNVTHFTCFELRIVSMGFKNGRIAAVSKAHLLEFYGVRHLRDWNMAQFVSQCQ